jgi:glycine cleavage system H protein
MNIPKDLKYAKTDEWIRVEGNQATVGISDYAQSQLSDIVYVEVLAKTGDTVAQGKPIASVESVKAASEIYLPAGGTVTETNDALGSAPEAVNKDPYGEGWMLKLTLSNPAELDGLMDATNYEAYCAGRRH